MSRKIESNTCILFNNIFIIFNCTTFSTCTTIKFTGRLYSCTIIVVYSRLEISPLPRSLSKSFHRRSLPVISGWRWCSRSSPRWNFGTRKDSPTRPGVKYFLFLRRSNSNRISGRALFLKSNVTVFGNDS